jgi:Tfp pilus assembly protein PilZ
MNRLILPLAERNDWLRVFDPRGGGVFVATDTPPAVGAEVRVDLTITVGGPRVILKGSVVWRREQADGRDPAGCSIGLAVEEREKINFINGYVRGGLINRRERRRLPLRLPITYGDVSGPRQTFTRDVNEEGLFILTTKPLPERTLLSFVLTLPDAPPFSLKGTVTHTVLQEDEDTPGMGVRFVFEGGEGGDMKAAIDKLEEGFYRGALAEEIIT